MSKFQHTVFDLTSKIVDFAVINDGHAPNTLVVLSEEEFVCIDLVSRLVTAINARFSPETLFNDKVMRVI